MDDLHEETTGGRGAPRDHVSISGDVTHEDSERLPSGGEPDTGPPPRVGRPGASGADSDPEARRVRDLVLSRITGRAPEPTKIGRFTILERLGRGGMGVVYAVYDPQLDRKVAVKLLRSDRDGSDGVDKRIVREAQAMAKLNHPNVAQVFEVGEHDGATFIAMEFIRGETLRSWCSEGDRTWREILDVYRQAAAGLLAAHRVGIVHRDFKPDNALVGRDGRVRVLDFGLAHGNAEAFETAEDDPQDPPSASGELRTPLTRTGAVLGTPAYMAPEQFLGETTDAKTDQFAFCIALWEALYGERPFSGSTPTELATQVLEGKLRDPARDSKVPSWIRPHLVRGLSVDPAERFPSLEPLAEALGHDPTRRRRRLLVAGGAVLLAAAGIGAFQLDRARTIEDCERKGEEIHTIWNDEVRSELTAAAVASEASDAEETIDRASVWIDERTEGWREARTEACLSARVEDSLDTAGHERALWCLDEQRVEIELFLEGMREPSRDQVYRAIDLAANLPLASLCTDPRALAQLPAPPPPEARDDARSISRELESIHLRLTQVEPDEARSRLEQLATEASELGWLPLESRIHSVLGSAMGWADSFSESEAAFTRSYELAARGRAWGLAATAALELVEVVGIRLARHEEGSLWLTQARIASELAGDPEGLRAAQLASNRARLLNRQGKWEESIVALESASELLSAAFGPTYPGLVEVWSRTFEGYARTGRLEEAAELAQRAVDTAEAVYGPGHVNTIASYILRGHALFSVGDHAGAVEVGEKVLAASERLYGVDGMDTVVSASNLCLSVLELEEYERAEKLCSRAVEWVETRGISNPDMAATAYMNRSVLYQRTGQLELALDDLENALRASEGLGTPMHPATGLIYTNIADTNLSLRRLEPCVEAGTLGLEVFTRSGETATAAFAYTTSITAACHTELGEPGKAIALLEEAIPTAPAPYKSQLKQRLGEAFTRAERYDDALATFRGELDAMQSAPHPDPHELAGVWFGIGLAQNGAQAWTEASEACTRTLELTEGHVDENALERALAHRCLGEAKGKLGEPEAAREHLETALRISRAVPHPDPKLIGELEGLVAVVPAH